MLVDPPAVAAALLELAAALRSIADRDEAPGW
jgi:hypothetical protein